MNTEHPKIAVVSMAGIFPGAPDTDRFIANILNKKEAVEKVPQNRWPAPRGMMVSTQSPCPADRAACDRAGLIKDFTFDPHGYDLKPGLLQNLDPVHHLVLATGKKAISKLKLDPETRAKTGVILAAIALPTERSSLLAEKLHLRPSSGSIDPLQALGATLVSSPAAILARALSLNGGSFTLDAACASSLFAIKLACEHLMLKKADLMVAGGVSRPDSLYTQVGFTQLSALSPSGICAPFDKGADGLVVGEGTGIVVLKRLEDALACGDTIHGVIRGWGVSNDIRGNLVAPASEGQVRAMTAAYEMAGWSPGDIQYMECHGSGTPKGDMVELGSIRQIFNHFDARAKNLGIGSVKSMIGHLLTAAGAAGFIKTLLAMEARTLPPSLNFNQLPENSPVQGTGIRVQSHPAPWQPGAEGLPRRAGISAFGFGGINAHILVEEYIRPASSEKEIHAITDPSQKSSAGPSFLAGAEPSAAPCAAPCAIIGMGVMTGAAQNLDEFDRLLRGSSPPPAPRWKDSGPDIPALFMETLGLDLREFHIPPNQIPDILVQHLVMLKAAKQALADAGISARPEPESPLRHRMGGTFGIEFDFGATDFFLRWHHHNQPGHVLDAISPPLTFDRTLGALGGIVASRIAREFQLGGPCFTLSAQGASGIKAIETGIHSLGAKETDIFICGAVDMAGDICSFRINQALGLFSDQALPSEGAAAIVLKPLDKALADRDRIYAVVTGMGSSGGDFMAGEPGGRVSDKIISLSMDRALSQAGISQEGISHIYGPGSIPHVSRTDTRNFMGETGAVSGLLSVMAAGLDLYREEPDSGRETHVIAGSTTPDGASAHAVLAKGGSRHTGLISPRLEPKPQKAPDMVIPTARPGIPKDIIKLLYPNPAEKRDSGYSPGLSQGSFAGPASPGSGSSGSSFPDSASSGLLPGSFAHLLTETHETTARAHEQFLELSSQNFSQMGKQLAALARAKRDPEAIQTESQPPGPREPANGARPLPSRPDIFLNREQCLEYAIGKAGNVLGPEFDIIDTYPVRVRLPAEPLMLVDRIMDIQGEMLSLTSGKIITQHDVLENAWYLDGGKAPVSISIEAGQADLFLCAWLGIDHMVKGTRKYRLLDARVTFHRSLPSPGETIEYHIEIDRFLRQGEIFLFFFHYKGYIDQRLFISMRDGCAGFFTEDEVKNSGGIILKKEERESCPAGEPLSPLVEMREESLSDAQVDCLRQGDLQGAFGPAFKGVVPGRNQWLPGGLMTLIHRVLTLEPRGGRFGLGRIVAEADIHPDDWFLTCHFIDDMVMPGTLMYECCAHTLRVFVQRMGWVSPSPDVHYDVLPGNESDLKCRGPVTRETKKARYEIEIKEMGYEPQPFVIADAHMFSDELRIVLYKNMGMKLVGTSHQDLMEFWRTR